MATLAQPPAERVPASVWIGRTLSALFVLFMLGASVAPKLLGLDAATQIFAELGWPARFVLLIGLFELAFTVLYAIPRTSVLGAILMTALLGGALATRMRVGSPLFSHTLFSIYLALFMWGGLWLRSPALRALIPFTQAKD
jgi:hypothetical protein